MVFEYIRMLISEFAIQSRNASNAELAFGILIVFSILLIIVILHSQKAVKNALKENWKRESVLLDALSMRYAVEATFWWIYFPARKLQTTLGKIKHKLNKK